MKSIKQLLLLIPAILLSGMVAAQATTANADFFWTEGTSAGCDSLIPYEFIETSATVPQNSQVFYEWILSPTPPDGIGSYYNQDFVTELMSGITYIVDLYVFSDPNFQNFLDSTSQTVVVAPAQSSLNATFTYSSNGSSSCGDETFVFQGSSTGNNTIYEWYINGNFVGNSQTHTEILTSGTHNMTLVVFDATGCSDSYSETITVQGQNGVQVAFMYTEASACFSEVFFDGTTIGGTPPYTYSWSFGSNWEDPSAIIQNGETVVVTATDANGCSGSYSEVIYYNDSAIYADASITYQSCGIVNCDATATINVQGGQSPFSYSIDGQVFGNSNVFNDLCTGSYDVEVLDANGCNAIATFYVDSAQASLQIQDYTYFGSCQDSSGGGQSYIEVYATSGTAPFTYSWNNGETDQFIQNLIAGTTYTVVVTDANGCTASATYNVPENDCYTIDGYVYIDDNSNCMQDTGEMAMSNTWVDLADADGNWTGFYAYTDANGYFSIAAPAGTYYFDVNGYTANQYTQECPDETFTVTLDANNPSATVDFYMTPPPPVQDLSVSMYNITTTTPGYPLWTQVTYCNDGTVPMSGNVVIEHDANLAWALSGTSEFGVNYNTSPAPDNYDANANTLTYNFSNLMPGSCQYLSIDYDVPSSSGLSIGDVVVNQAVTNPIAGDVTPDNNSAYLVDSVTTSWDPNDKAVFPNGDITQDDKDHSYHIRFQNEGTANATVVVVRDDLDDNLDLQSLRNVSASHNFVLTFENDDELVFTFNNIQLPPKDVDEEGSQGFVDFTVSQKADLPVGTTIENTAEIFFDFNEAIITNTVSNKIIEDVVGIHDAKIGEAITVYPNPSTGSFKIDAAYTIKSIKVMDVIGNVVFVANEINNKNAMLQLSDVSEGVYFIQINTNEGAAVQKVAIQK